MRNPELLERRLQKLNTIFKNLHFLLNRHDSTKDQFSEQIKEGEEMVETISDQIERELGATRNG